MSKKQVVDKIKRDQAALKLAKSKRAEELKRQAGERSEELGRVIPETPPTAPGDVKEESLSTTLTRSITNIAQLLRTTDVKNRDTERKALITRLEAIVGNINNIDLSSESLGGVIAFLVETNKELAEAKKPQSKIKRDPKHPNSLFNKLILASENLENPEKQEETIRVIGNRFVRAPTQQVRAVAKTVKNLYKTPGEAKKAKAGIEKFQKVFSEAKKGKVDKKLIDDIKKDNPGVSEDDILNLIIAAGRIYNNKASPEDEKTVRSVPAKLWNKITGISGDGSRELMAVVLTIAKAASKQTWQESAITLFTTLPWATVKKAATMIQESSRKTKIGSMGALALVAAAYNNPQLFSISTEALGRVMSFWRNLGNFNTTREAVEALVPQEHRNEIMELYDMSANLSVEASTNLSVEEKTKEAKAAIEAVEEKEPVETKAEVKEPVETKAEQQAAEPVEAVEAEVEEPRTFGPDVPRAVRPREEIPRRLRFPPETPEPLGFTRAVIPRRLRFPPEPRGFTRAEREIPETSEAKREIPETSEAKREIPETTAFINNENELLEILRRAEDNIPVISALSPEQMSIAINAIGLIINQRLQDFQQAVGNNNINPRIIEQANDVINMLTSIQPDTTETAQTIENLQAGVESIKDLKKAEERVVDVETTREDVDDAFAQRGDRKAGKLRPKFILPSTDVLSVDETEIQQQLTDFSLFGFVPEDSQGADGNSVTNLLKKNEKIREFFRYGASIDQFTRTDTYKSRNLDKLRPADLTILTPMRFDEFDLEKPLKDPENFAGNRYDDPYAGFSDAYPEDSQLRRSVLYSIVP